MLLPCITAEKAVRNYVKAVGKGVLEVMSKMGISTVASYCGAQVFEAVRLDRRLVECYFTGTSSVIGGYQWRHEGEVHLFNPETVFLLQHATQARRYKVVRSIPPLWTNSPAATVHSR